MSENTAQKAAEPQAVQQPVRNKYAGGKKKRGMPKWLKIIIVLILIAALCGTVFYFVRKFTSGSGSTTIEDTIVSRGTLSSQVTGWGTVVARQTAEYGADSRGTVTEVAVQAGDIVKAGDLLFVIDPSELREGLATAEEALRTAADGVTKATKALSNTSLTAPFSGKLILPEDFTELRTGQDISAGQSLGTLVDDSVMKLELYFSYAYENDIYAGQSVSISVPESMVQVTGTVESIDKISRPIDGAVCFRVNVAVPNAGTLTAGQSAAGYITAGGVDMMPATGGTLKYNQEQELTMPVGGTLQFVDLMDYGEYSSGQTLCSVDASSLQADLNAAQKTYDEAAETVSKLQADMTNTEIRSEINGVVSNLVVAVGDKLQASGTPVVTVSDTSSLLVEASIDELDINNVQLGMPVTITYGDGNSTSMGEVTYVGFEAKSENTGMGAVAYFPARFSIGADAEGSLLPGMGVNYTITSVIKEDCLVVPSKAVIFTEAGTVVYVKKGMGFDDYPVASLSGGSEEGTEPVEGGEDISVSPDMGVSVSPDMGAEAEAAESQVPEGYYPVAVEIGLSDANNTEIVSGLEEGTTIYLTTYTNTDGSYYYYG